MYISPITQYETEMKLTYENGVFKAVQRVGFDVNKEELTKALLYDRGQYDKGYKEGYAKALDDLIYTAICESCSGCTNCYETASQYRCDHYSYVKQIAEQLKTEV